MSETKTPEEIAAELKLEADRKLAQEQAAKELLQAKKTKAGDLHFVRGADVYQVLLQRIIIPDVGERTALELMVDDDAQAALVAMESGAIQKIG